MPTLSAPEISRLLRELGDRIALQGGNPYRSRAYSRAADNLALTTFPHRSAYPGRPPQRRVYHGSDFVMDGGVTSAYWYGDLASK